MEIHEKAGGVAMFSESRDVDFQTSSCGDELWILDEIRHDKIQLQE